MKKVTKGKHRALQHSSIVITSNADQLDKKKVAQLLGRELVELTSYGK